MKAPFPYFGGKSMIADIIWQTLGQPKHYLEPFCGSCAVLLARPNYDQSKHVESVNDMDGNIINIWRSLKLSPEKTAEFADEPVHHIELTVWKRIINQRYPELKQKLLADENYHDPQIAGRYIWASCCWIGSGLTCPGQIPHLADAGKGVHAIGQIPHLGHAGRGVHAIGKIPHLADAGRGVLPRSEHIYQWFAELSARLRRVRVVCGDWKRVCGGNWQDKIGDCGIFFDPPYGHGDGKRDTGVYHHDSIDISADVREWCIKRGDKPTYRIVLAGYEGEHNELEKHGWTKVCWRAMSGYANNQRKDDSDAVGKGNAKLERLWISPHCINPQQELFQ